MSIYDDLVATGRYDYVANEPNFALHLKNRSLPVSIKLSEFDYIKDIIVKNKCVRGYEIATGFGISSLAAALGFKENNGKLVTLDAYIEENFTLYTYDGTITEVNKNSDGFKSVNCLIKEYELENTLFPKIGWSPQDVEKVLKEEFKNIEEDKLDYVFIDGEHSFAAIERDMNSILKFVNSNTTILIHDVSSFFIEHVKKLSFELLNRQVEIVKPYPNGFDLALIH